ncbi:MAG: hypothetical protein HQL38_18585 [Alphaproteobacteria bacterium]|nr:hypothetical protein [Alphaproteobacteria bacterium]
MKRMLPIHMDRRSDVPSLDWIDFTGERLIGPFFDDDVLRVGRSRPVVRTPLDDLHTMGQALPAGEIAGFIFHMSRCGSTLLARMLAQLPETIVLSEPQPILVALPLPGTARRCLPLLGGLLRAYAQRSAGTGSRLIVKFGARDAAALGFVRANWPRVPVALVIRDPIEVMVSNLREPAPWLRAAAHPLMAAATTGLPPEEFHDVDRETFLARSLGLFCEQALANREAPFVAVDYTALPWRGFHAVADLFGLTVDARARAAIVDLVGWHAKSPNRPFEPDAARKRSVATSAMIAAAERWALPAYRRLASIAVRG